MYLYMSNGIVVHQLDRSEMRIFFQSFVVNAFQQCNILQYQRKKKKDMVFSEIIKHLAYFALFFIEKQLQENFLCRKVSYFSLAFLWKHVAAQICP